MLRCTNRLMSTIFYWKYWRVVRSQKSHQVQLLMRNTLETGNVNEMHDIYTDKVLKVNQYRIRQISW